MLKPIYNPAISKMINRWLSAVAEVQILEHYKSDYM